MALILGRKFHDYIRSYLTTSKLLDHIMDSDKSDSNTLLRQPSHSETVAECNENEEPGKNNLLGNELTRDDENCHKKDPRKPRRKKPKPGFHLEMFQETSYYFQDGLRYVYPYPFTFTAFVKGRWLNMTILELFSKEFHMETMDYYKKAIIDGKIRLNDKPVSTDTILSNGDILKTMVHRHEPPVVNDRIELLRNDKEMVVINKPASVPVHPCGRYRHNTIVFILGKEYGLHGLHTIHRLDRLTSGVLMFAKNVEKAKEIEDQIHKQGNVEKEYLARVVGEFPNEVTVDQPILTASHKIGVCHVNKSGKNCVTQFTRISYNGKSSVVRCKPKQGRMHQIRVHLQWLGHPIVNDPIYNHPTAWGDGKRKHEIDEVIIELINTRKDKSYDDDLSTNKDDNTFSKVKLSTDNNTPLSKDNEKSSKRIKLDDQLVNSVNSNNKGTHVKGNDVTQIPNESIIVKELDESTTNSSEPSYDKNTSYTSRDIGEEYVDLDCTDCKRVWKKPALSEMVMYLHSLSYKGPDWEYKTSVPTWAEEGWDED